MKSCHGPCQQDLADIFRRNEGADRLWESETDTKAMTDFARAIVITALIAFCIVAPLVALLVSR